MSRTPRTIHKFVDALCLQIRSGSTPVRVAVVPDAGAQPSYCFINVNERVARNGGRIQYGWCLWELPGLFIEAEAHAVWVNPSDGCLIDVTPNEYQETEIVFLPDDSVTYDEKATRRRENVRMAIKDHPVVRAFIKTAEEYADYLEKSTDPNNPGHMIIDPRVERTLMMRKVRLQCQMKTLPVGRNDMCRCGSGVKYKKCCGR